MKAFCWTVWVVSAICTVGSLIVIADWWFCKDGCNCVGPGCAIKKYGEVPPEWRGLTRARPMEVVPELPKSCVEAPDGKDCAWVGDVDICDGWCLCRFERRHLNRYNVVCTDRKGNQVN